GLYRPPVRDARRMLTATIAAGDIAAAGTASVTVFNPTPGGGLSTAASFTISAANPVPVVSGLVPSSAAAGGAGFTLTVNGSSFVATSVGRWHRGVPTPHVCDPRADEHRP